MPAGRDNVRDDVTHLRDFEPLETPFLSVKTEVDRHCAPLRQDAALPIPTKLSHFGYNINKWRLFVKGKQMKNIMKNRVCKSFFRFFVESVQVVAVRYGSRPQNLSTSLLSLKMER